MTLEYRIEEAASMMSAAVPVPGSESIITSISTDTRTIKRGALFFALSGANYDGDAFVEEAFSRGAVAAVTHKNHDMGTCIVVEEPLRALQELAAEHRARSNAQVIAITGSCGKTTSKDMIAALLGAQYSVVKTKGNLNNDIGCPLSLLRIMADTEFAVIEMGANHQKEIAHLCEIAKPDESAVTLVAAAHLEGFGSIEDIARAKSEIVTGLSPTGCFYVNMDDPRCRVMAELHPGEKVRFGKEGDVRLESIILTDEEEMTLNISPIGRLQLPLKVKAHASNVLLAVAVGLRHGITEFEAPLREACANAARFKTLRVGSITILDDTYNANPASMAAAVEALQDQPGTGRRLAILGAMFELGDAAAQLHYDLGALAAHSGLSGLIARGPNAEDMIEGAHDAGLEEAYVFNSVDAATAMARRMIAPGDIVLVKGSRGMRMEEVVHKLREFV
ncbi:MAG: UDP-N-acetylmuramoyl-tripeptide--D-alanyl-D-alanine ligase [Candidatus Hydrogenedentes bacterium]|nr:UDP-N-acetylmuramoyl-tripeptide--D-alanyl-D-alanine ligase [Candidatus Hydrogenedentota bacterium]